MKQFVFLAAAGAMLVAGSCTTTTADTISPPNVKLGQAFSDAIIYRYPDPNSIMNKGWEYNTSIVLHGMEKIYRQTKNPAYLAYIKKWVDSFIMSDGRVNFSRSACNLDYLHPGVLLLLLWEETHDNKYRVAAQDIRTAFNSQPKNMEGGFWHKERYPNEMWADGIYMGEPFIMKYGVLFGETDVSADMAAFQTLLIARHAQDPKTGLLFHGWDSDKNASWADSATGVSGFIWSRGMGWYAMALVDILAWMPATHRDHKNLVSLLGQIAGGLKKTQDPATGLWFQVMDQGDKKDNWLELSGSAMFVYALKIAVDRGYISADYLPVAQKGWEGVKSMVSFSGGRPSINGAVAGMGIKGSYNEYISQSRLSNSAHGYASVLFASSVMEY
ncbi:MAG: glycoside hydrolase family 88 protein [Spirochaetaceae bacterium]|nr:MAG: glycoside hydrolase family 88 protein [Spirochaetaceae bacterium]